VRRRRADAVTTSGRCRRCTRVRCTLTWAVLLPVVLATAGSRGTAPAWASCASPGALTSPNAFAGTVTATSRSGRVAEVRTDEGHHVTVIGTPVVPDPSGADRATSIDRTYEVGVRYEFDPRNSTSPYEDTACTSTHVLPPLAPTAAPTPAAPTPAAPTPSAPTPSAPTPSAPTVSSSPSAAAAGTDAGGASSTTTIAIMAVVVLLGLSVIAAALLHYRTSRVPRRPEFPRPRSRVRRTDDAGVPGRCSGVKPGVRVLPGCRV